MTEPALDAVRAAERKAAERIAAATREAEALC